eukprot:COSAG01_NODE_3326_length_6222_cov_19.423834_1_plen_84_part_00
MSQIGDGFRRILAYTECALLGFFIEALLLLFDPRFLRQCCRLRRLSHTQSQHSAVASQHPRRGSSLRRPAPLPHIRALILVEL